MIKTIRCTVLAITFGLSIQRIQLLRHALESKKTDPVDKSLKLAIRLPDNTKVEYSRKPDGQTEVWLLVYS